MKHVRPALLKELQDAGWHSRGYLPHFDGGEIAQTITVRLADSLPIEVLKQWMKELFTESGRGAETIVRRRVEAARGFVTTLKPSYESIQSWERGRPVRIFEQREKMVRQMRIASLL